MSKPSLTQNNGIDRARSVTAIENTLLQCLPVDFGVTPGQFRDLCDMILTDMLLRGVTPEFWAKVSPVCLRGIELACRIEAEVTCSKVEGVNEAAAKTLMDAANLSLNEIKAIRVSLLECVKELMECREPGSSVN